jgi:SMODS and SLOG-associating 2TM effector domain 1/Protein of unknown function (DUF4231)
MQRLFRQGAASLDPVENAWNEYRGWAKRARQLQEQSQFWAKLAMGCAVLAAVLGAAAGQAGTGHWWGRILAFLAAAFAAVTPVLGQDILAVGREAGWIRARATAEAIKSECFRYAARAGDYASPNATNVFVANRTKLGAVAAAVGLTQVPDPAQNDPRRPFQPMDADWYLEHRLREQRTYYAHRQQTHETAITQLRYASLAAAVLAAVVGAASGVFDLPSLAVWIGALTTVGGMIVSYGLMERRQYLAASFGAMATALGRVEDRYNAGGIAVATLVEETEQLLTGEHLAWSERMTKTIPAPPVVAPPTPPPEPPNAQANPVH